MPGRAEGGDSNSEIHLYVDDIHAVLATVIKAGGTQIGEITDFGTADRPLPIAYARDPEGNVLEFEQAG